MNKAVEYAKWASRKNNKKTPKYVKKQCKIFLDVYQNKDKKYVFSEKNYKKIENIMKLLVMPKGLLAGKTLYECNLGYQWLILSASMCIVHRDDPEHRRYEKIVLLIGRKNYKTYTISEIMETLMLTEPKFSKLYSGAPDGDLSRELKEALEKTLKMSPKVFKDPKGKERFKITRDYIEFLMTETKYVPLNYKKSTFDGKLANAFCVDEVGCLKDNSIIDSLSSGQIGILNAVSFIISTKYPTADNPIETEVEYAKKVLDGVIDDDKIFALLYEPDDPDAWMVDDNVIYHANPAAVEQKFVFDKVVKKRTEAINKPETKENFLTKHLNIIYQSSAEAYVQTEDVIGCGVEYKIDWTGRNVYVGVDMAMTDDNVSVSMIALDTDGTILVNPMCFIPEDKIDEKIKTERVNYKMFIEKDQCIACGDRIIDYSVVEDYVFSLEEKYKVKIIGIGYDRYNCLSSAQKWAQKYNTYEIKQHSSVLHPDFKLLKEYFMQRKIKYERNMLYVINYQNARCVYDTNNNLYVSKKKSSGKVDMVMSTIDAVHILNEEVLLNKAEFVSTVLEI